MTSLYAFAAQYLFLSIPLALLVVWWRLPKERQRPYTVQLIATRVHSPSNIAGSGVAASAVRKRGR